MENEEEPNISIDQEEPQNEELVPNDDSQTTTVEEKAISEKDKVIAEILKAVEERRALMYKNKQLQHQLSLYTKEAITQANFQTSDLPTDASEDIFKRILENIDDKQREIEEYRKKTKEKMDLLKSEISRKEEEGKGINDAFVAAKERTALHSVHSENGKQYTKKEVEELLQKEKKARTILENLQLEAIKTHHVLQTTIKEKKNLVEGPLDYGEYEIMCTSTENNSEVIKQLKEEIKEFTKKSCNAVNILSHLLQKLQSAQSISETAEKTEKQLEKELKEMRNELFKEKLQYTRMNDKNEDLQHKTILLQYPRLIEDYKNILIENEDARKEIERLKNIYTNTKKLISQ